jgi:hypothetical protein
MSDTNSELFSQKSGYKFFTTLKLKTGARCFFWY